MTKMNGLTKRDKKHIAKLMGEGDAMRTITYYAIAERPDGKIGQLLVTRGGGIRTQEWTGKTYKSTKQGLDDCGHLNR